jgi:hypothetical protein
MDDVSARLRMLGGRISDTSERLTDSGELSAARRLWLESPAPRATRSRPRTVLAVAVAAFLAAVVMLVGTLRPRGGVAFVVGSPPARGTVGDFIAADESTLPILFSEGTIFTLAPGARARVTETNAHGATLLLEKGDVGARVAHAGADTRWGVRAGPFEVRVVGTKFDVSWDPGGGTFDLVLHEGVVVVTGPLLQRGHELHAGERLRVSVRDASLELRAANAPSPPQPAPAQPAQAQASPQAATVETCGAPCPPAALPPAALREKVTTGGPAPVASTASSPSWRELAATGKYNEALAAAERAGFAQEIERASSQDLATLADAARYGGRPVLATQALLAQRRRFGMRGASAFLLGKIAADQQGTGAEAARWFETYLQEEPNGALTEQALGRLLQMRKGDLALGRATAERYLARYPRGVHAALARSLLTGPASMGLSPTSPRSGPASRSGLPSP